MLLHGILYLVILLIAMLIGIVLGAFCGLLIFWFLFQLYEWRVGRRRIPSSLLRASAALGAISGMLLMRGPADQLASWLGWGWPIP